jgi:hypothetical protein
MISFIQKIYRYNEGTEHSTVMNIMYTYRARWKGHVLMMPLSRIPLQLLRYRPEGKWSTGRPFKLWKETVMGHWAV